MLQYIVPMLILTGARKREGWMPREVNCEWTFANPEVRTPEPRHLLDATNSVNTALGVMFMPMVSASPAAQVQLVQ